MSLPRDTKEDPLPPGVELLELDGGLSLRSDTPLFCSALDLIELEEIADLWINSVKASTSARHIVLETWLLVDHSLRLLLGGAFGFTQHSTDALELRHELLPQSFEQCLKLLKRLRAEHLKLPIQKPTSALTMSIEFWSHLSRNDRELLDKLIVADRAYVSKRFGVLDTYHADGTMRNAEGKIVGYRTRPARLLTERVPMRLPEGWMDATARLDAAWFKAARQLNDARNKAAHSTDTNRILREMDISGANALEDTRQYCESVVGTLIGIVRSPSATP